MSEKVTKILKEYPNIDGWKIKSEIYLFLDTLQKEELIEYIINKEVEDRK